MKGKIFKYFIPNEGNDYKPYFFRGKSVFFLVLMILLFFFFSLSQYLFIKNTNLAAVISSVLVDLANEDRQENDLPPLALDPLLTEAAKQKAEHMASQGYFAHTSPDGVAPWHWFKEAGYDFIYAGENLAVNFSDSYDVERAWMESQSHRDNILNSNFTEIGIATAKGEYKGRKTIFVVQMFGKPIPKALTEIPPAREEPELQEISQDETFAAVKDKAHEDLPSQEVQIGGMSYASVIEEFTVSPKRMLYYSYIIIGFVVVITLGFLVFIKKNVQYPLNIIYALFVVALMVGLLYLHDAYLMPDVMVI